MSKIKFVLYGQNEKSDNLEEVTFVTYLHCFDCGGHADYLVLKDANKAIKKHIKKGNRIFKVTWRCSKCNLQVN